MYIGIGMVSLWIDRRALMVSALGYVLYAFSALLQNSGLVSLGFALTALVVGCALLLLSAFWQRSRAITLPWLPRPAAPRAGTALTRSRAHSIGGPEHARADSSTRTSDAASRPRPISSSARVA
jgi:hypothetical protein